MVYRSKRYGAMMPRKPGRIRKRLRPTPKMVEALETRKRQVLHNRLRAAMEAGLTPLEARAFVRGFPNRKWHWTVRTMNGRPKRLKNKSA